MKALVDEAVCTGCGLCVDICPEVFDVNDIATVKVAVVPSDAEDDCRDATESCPVEAISIED